MYPATTPHLNAFGCEIRATEEKGRGVFATQPLAALTTIEISPVLFLSKEEYEQHGRYTVLDHYTFKWRDGRHALALGLGSIFNHASSPNVSYVIDTKYACIKYTTTRYVAAGEELCIFYGDELWFEDRSGSPKPTKEDSEDEDAWACLANVEWENRGEESNELILEKDLPFERVAVVGDDDEEESEGVLQTTNAWVVDIPDPRKTSEMIQWLKREGLEDPSLKHVKHVRKWTPTGSSDQRTTLLVSPADKPPPTVPGELEPYILPVPRYPARTMDQVQTKAAVWPVFYEGRGHAQAREEARRWTRATVQWFRDAVAVLRREAKRARLRGEIPIVSYVPVPLNGVAGSRSFIAHDTRVSSQHPLRHSVFNVVRLVGDSVAPPTDPPAPLQNGQHYLLTSRTLFTTHEPCIACSMALLHSRVNEVVYVYSMPNTGGCGSVTCVPGLKGVNHRYKLWKWRDVPDRDEREGVEQDTDA